MSDMMRSDTPKISVVMSVYNCEKYVGDTIQSVIDQTFTNWEFIIINDCSKDKSAEVIRSFDDPRIIFIDNTQNMGQCANLNRGIELSRGEYIARLDHDDLCLPTRFEKQLEYMEQHPDVIMCGCGCNEFIDGNIKETYAFDVKSTKEMEWLEALMFNRIAHSAFFLRKDLLAKFDLKYGDYGYCEDYALILAILKYGEVGFIKDKLVLYRKFEEQTSATLAREIQLDEDIAALDEYWNDSSFAGKEILLRACKGKLCKFSDYKAFTKAFVAFADSLELGDNPKEIIGNTNNAVELYLSLVRKQKKTVAWYFNRLITKFK